MCLQIDASTQLNFDEEGYCEGYKGVEDVHHSYIGLNTPPEITAITPFYGSVLQEQRPFDSNRPSKQLLECEKICDVVERGIHVYLSIEDLRKDIGRFGYVIVKCKCHKNDLVATGTQRCCEARVPGAVFMKVFIEKIGVS